MRPAVTALGMLRRRNGRPLWSGALVLIAGVAGSPVFAAETIGKAEKIEKSVSGEVDGAKRDLKVPDEVHRDEMIRTGNEAQGHFRFSDETDLKLGPKASLKLDAFVFSGKKDAAMELVSGSMRFVSGKGPKGSYLIRTPVATIGLRGTTVEVTVRDGRTYVSLHEGQVQVCTRSGRCMDLNNTCTYLSVDRRGVTTPQPLSNRVPTYSGACKGEFCVVDSCTPQLSSPPRADRPKARPLRELKKVPRKVKAPLRGRGPGRYVEEEIILDEPTYVRPRPPRYPVDVVPVFPVDPGFIRPGRPPRGGYPTRPPRGDRGGGIKTYPSDGGPGITPRLDRGPRQTINPGFNRGGFRRGGGFDIR